jgi:uncharacterized protein (DUF697 family)
MTQEQEAKCHAIIHAAATACAGVGAGLAQLPGSDNAVIVPIQLVMITSLGAVFGIELTKSAATSTVASATASLTGRAISQWFVGWIPLAGNLINASTAFTITESIGWSCAKSFESQEKNKKRL